MLKTNYLNDKDFLAKLDLARNKKTYVKIIVLNVDEQPVRNIEGRVSSGSINIDGSSSMRRTCNLTFIADKNENDLTNVDNLLSINKKIKIEIGIENNIDDKYGEKIWFKQGVFVIVQPSFSHNLQGINISLSCKDKMCLLNGECGGSLPASVTFDKYIQIKEDGGEEEILNPVYDIIETLLLFYGNEKENNIIINDIPRRKKQAVYWNSSQELYYNYNTGEYTTDFTEVEESMEINQTSLETEEEESSDNEGTNLDNDSWTIFKYNDNIGYVYTDYTYTGTLTSGIGESIVSILDKIKNFLGNFEYFYDIEGRFVFQEIKNYLNTTYNPAVIKNKNDSNEVYSGTDNNLYILDNTNYYMDLDLNGKVIYNFTENNGLISSYNNSLTYSNIKNDFHVWGKGDNGYSLHYHLVIKQKPTISQEPRAIVLLRGADDKYNGTLRLKTIEDDKHNEEVSGFKLTRSKKNPNLVSIEPKLTIDSKFIFDEAIEEHSNFFNQSWKYKTIFNTTLNMTNLKVFSKTGYYYIKLGIKTTNPGINITYYVTGVLYVPNNIVENSQVIFYSNEALTKNRDVEINIEKLDTIEYNSDIVLKTLSIKEDYIPADWRAELYLKGLEKLQIKQKPDIYEQEILDLFSSIYDFSIQNEDGTYGAFKEDIHNPNNLLYFIDYLEPQGRIADCSVDTIGQKIQTYSLDNINKIYESTAIPDNILVCVDGDLQNSDDPEIIKYRQEGVPLVNVTEGIYSRIVIGLSGTAADNVARELLYQYTNYNSIINLQSIPIYYLEPNRRITVNDRISNIQGDYIIKSFSLPLDGKTTMTISASKALERV